MNSPMSPPSLTIEAKIYHREIGLNGIKHFHAARKLQKNIFLASKKYFSVHLKFCTFLEENENYTFLLLIQEIR